MSPADQPSPTSRRIAVGSLAMVTIAAGLLVHRFGSGVAGDAVGDALYAALVYLLLALLAPRAPRRMIAAGALILCAAVEFLQLTDIPREAAAVFPPAVLVLGAGFDQRDLLVYAAAVVVALLLDAAISRTARRTRQPR